MSVTRLRRDLADTDDVPDPLIHELRACADALERHGIAVDLISPAGTIPILPAGILAVSHPTDVGQQDG